MFSSTFKITIVNAYAIGWFLYLIVPALFLVFDSSLSSRAMSFEILIVFAASAFSWWLGTCYCSYLCVTSRQFDLAREAVQTPELRPESGSIAGFFTVIGMILFMLSIQINSLYGGLASYLSSSYGNFDVEGVNSLSSSAALITIGLIFGFQKASENRKMLNFIIGVITAFISLLWIAGGLRNLTAMLLIGAAFAAYRNRRLSIIVISGVILLVITLSAFIAVFRNASLLSILFGEFDLSSSVSDSLDYLWRYLDGEFGTPYRVYIYLKSMPSAFEVMPLKSYLLDPLLNLIPTFIIPDRPPSLATLFTYSYFQSTSPPEGLGFSFINEAILNFGILFPIPIVLFGFVIALISKKFENRLSPSPGLFFVSIALVAASLNIFRIDFALFVKFIVTIYLSARVSYCCCRCIK